MYLSVSFYDNHAHAMLAAEVPHMSLTLIEGQEAIYTPTADDASGALNPRQGNLTATLANGTGTGAYVALVGGAQLFIVAPLTSAGTYTLTLTGTSQNGSPIPGTPIVVNVTITAPAKPQAQEVTLGNPVIQNQDAATPPNPGGPVSWVANSGK